MSYTTTLTVDVLDTASVYLYVIEISAPLLSVGFKMSGERATEYSSPLSVNIPTSRIV